MSAQPDHIDDNMVSIEINGKALKAPKGSMIIQAADLANIAIPRFCYHKKLTIHANCRVCMVEVEMGGRAAPKPLPACATPVSDGMKVLTKSEKAMSAQRNGLEFLLINHPLDCPVCDQGGECELQDLALGFGRSVSRFTERKRVVADENIGPLIATEMTRCIHCMRCVRFLREIGGTNELGGMDRGDRMVIGTYIGRSVESEVGGNIIDLCPVGALTNKPFQFKARAWELVARMGIGYHDALGSNLWLHTRRGKVLRTVPRENETINECWLSDRDRYSCDGMHADDRVLRPRVKRDGKWVECEWDEALDVAAGILKSVAGDDLGILVNPATTSEEGLLLKRLADDLGTAHIDHRLRQLDFADQAVAQPFGMPVEAIDKLDAALILGSDTRSEMPLLHHRLRQASTGIPKHADTANRARFDITFEPGAKLHVLNPAGFEINYELASETIVPVQAMVDAALALAAAAAEAGQGTVPGDLADAIKQVEVTEAARTSIRDLTEAASSVVLLGEIAAQHPQASWLRAAGRYIASATGSELAEIPMGANAIGLAQQNVLPGDKGLDAHGMLARPRKSYVLYGIDLPNDFSDGRQADAALKGADKVVAFASFAAPALLDVADVILPIALMPETEASMVNVDGVVQQFAAGAGAPGDARSGWKVLRALGGQLGLDGFDFTNIDQVREGLANGQVKSSAEGSLAERGTDSGLVRLATRGIYRVDAVVRRTKSLQEHPLNRAPAVRLHADDAARLGLADDDQASVDGVVLPVVVDANVPAGCAWIEIADQHTAMLPPCGATLNVNKA